jgi:hypothetical protein
MKHTKTIPIIVYLLFLTGCSTQSYAEWDQERRQKQIDQLSEQARQRDSNPNKYAYEEAAQHGCNSGSNATGNYAKQYYKDVDRYIKDPYYKNGWDDGFNQCKGQGELINGVINNSVR